MHRFLTAIFSVAGLFGMLAMAVAAGSHTPDQAKALVEKAAQYLKSEGKEKALAAFSDPNGEFVDGDLYLAVIDANDGKLTMLAHGANKGLIGKPQIDLKDAEGRAFIRELAATMANATETWDSYAWPNATTKKIAKKKTYWLKVGDVFIGAGIYE